MEIFNTILLLFSGYVLFSVIFNLIRIYNIVSSPDYVDPDEPPAQTEVVTEFQQIDGQYYMWDRETGDFITQAPTLQGIFDNCVKYHKNKIFHITKEDVEKYDLKKQLPEAIMGVGQ